MTRRYIRGLSKEARAKPARRGEFRIMFATTWEPDEDVAARLRAAAPNVEVVGPEEKARADLVVMPVDIYERLLDAADERAAVAAYKDTRAEEKIPHAIVKRIAAGENPIRVWREHRGMTLEELAKTIGRGKSLLSEIENNKKTGSIATLRAIAGALRVELDDVAV